MWKAIGLWGVAIALCLPAGSANAGDDERANVLAAMDRVLETVSTGTADDWRAIQLAEGSILSFRPLANGEAGQLEMRIASLGAFVASTPPGEIELKERWTEEPTVMIRGPIAVVWGEYEFWINGEFSHCGVNSLDFAKVDGAWKVANWTYTVEPEGCPTDPSANSDD